MAITGSLTIIDTDFSDSLGGIVSACSINTLRVTATLTGGSDSNAYCTVNLTINNIEYIFKMINRTFNGTTGEFYFDFTDILPYFFQDISDNELTTGVQEVVDTYIKINDSGTFVIHLYNGIGTELDLSGWDQYNLLFSAQQIGNSNGSNETNINNGDMPNFLAQKNKQSYIYFYGTGEMEFTKVESLPSQYVMIDNNNSIIVDNNGDAMINEY